MEVIKFTAKIDDSGQLNINLPTNLKAGRVDLIVVVNPITDEEQKGYDFSDLQGKLNWQGDAVTMQRQLRDEW